MPGSTDNAGWEVLVSDQWDILGPFPMHGREQHFLSPSYPLNLSENIDYNLRWPSSYADSGTVGWTRAVSSNGNLAVSFPDIRWDSIRATEGWAALQHHTVLRTSIVVHTPHNSSLISTELPRLSISLLQGSFFTIIPSTSRDPTSANIISPKWYAGNIYAMSAAPPHIVDLPMVPDASLPTKYDLFVSGDYEIRLFGDPYTRHADIPELQINLSVGIELPRLGIDIQESHHVKPDFVDGWAFGEALGIGLCSTGGWWTVKDVSIVPGGVSEAVKTELLHHISLAPTQTRIVPILLIQSKPFLGSELHLEIVLTSGHSSLSKIVTLPLNHRRQWDDSHFSPITASYFFATSMPTSFLVIPPTNQNQGRPLPPVLALHGAGVDILEQLFWTQALPRQQRSWVISPTGRTPWGLDWHGPSAQDAWSTINAVYHILDGHPFWKPWAIAKNTRVLIIGHSNGGQGAWYMAARHPDRVIGAVPAAAYIKSQAYVPLTQSRSGHYIDPALNAILSTSLTPDDNDLFLSNLVDTPILAIHGGDDENVPVWHTREAVSVLKTWRSDANVTLKEDPGQPHWYPSVFDNPEVQAFIRRILEQDQTQLFSTKGRSFTLTAAIPSESGSLHGWRIENILIPGRLARLTVEKNEAGIFHVKTRNVLAFSLDLEAAGLHDLHLVVDGNSIMAECEGNKRHFLQRRGTWAAIPGIQLPIQPSGRLANILTSEGPLIVIIPDDPTPSIFSAALRIAHDLDVYHKLDAEIKHASQALSRAASGSFGNGNLIVLGGNENAFTRHLLEQRRTPFEIQGTQLHLKGRPVHSTLFLHPHPANISALSLLVYSDDDQGLERALRLFPIRTGVAVPDWILLGDTSDVIAAGGIQGAGVWGNEWTWNEAVSSF